MITKVLILLYNHVKHKLLCLKGLRVISWCRKRFISTISFVEDRICGWIEVTTNGNEIRFHLEWPLLPHKFIWCCGTLSAALVGALAAASQPRRREYRI